MSESMEDIGYFGDDIQASGDTLKDLTALCDNMQKLRVSKTELEDKVTEINIQLKTIEEKIIHYFKEYGLPSLHLDDATFFIKKEKTFSQPATPEDKAALFSYLKEKDLFDGMISVNSRTLTSWAKREVEVMEKTGKVGWLPPGLKQPSEYEKINIRKK